MKFNTRQALIYIGVGLLLIGLGLYAYLGIYNRYFADDWCYNKDINRMGYFGVLDGYNYIGTYASNRYALTLFSSLIYRFDLAGVQWMTALTLLIWWIGLGWLLQEINILTRKGLGGGTVWLLSGLIVFFMLEISPHVYQNFYWRSGLLPYTAPLVLVPYVLAILARNVSKPATNRWAYFAIAILSLLIGGFSEIASTFFVAATGILFGLVLYGLAKRQNWARQVGGLAATALMFAIVALILEIASPANGFRQANTYGEPTALAALPAKVLIYTYYFFRVTTSQHASDFYLIFGLAFSSTLLTHPSKDAVMPTWQQILGLVSLIVASMLGLIAASLTPTLYIQGSMPTIRAEIVPNFALIGATVGVAIVLGRAIQPKIEQHWLSYVGLVIYLIGLIFLVRNLPAITAKMPLYASRAEIWDERDAYVRKFANEGITEFEVRGIDGAPIGGLHDIKTNPKHWVNRCAAHYYGIEEIQATK